MKQSNMALAKEKHLVESISKMSTQLHYRGEKNQSRHSEFLQEIIEDMQEQLNMIRGDKR